MAASPSNLAGQPCPKKPSRPTRERARRFEGLALEAGLRCAPQTPLFAKLLSPPLPEGLRRDEQITPAAKLTQKMVTSMMTSACSTDRVERDDQRSCHAPGKEHLQVDGENGESASLGGKDPLAWLSCRELTDMD